MTERDDGNCKENVVLNIELCVKLTLFQLLMVITLYKIGGVEFRLLGTNGFHVKAKNERSTTASFCCRQNFQCENFTSSFGRLARAARLFFCIQPIKSLIYGVVVAVDVVKSETPELLHRTRSLLFCHAILTINQLRLLLVVKARKLSYSSLFLCF